MILRDQALLAELQLNIGYPICGQPTKSEDGETLFCENRKGICAEHDFQNGEKSACSKCGCQFQKQPAANGDLCRRCLTLASYKTLKNCVPREFFVEFMTVNGPYNPAFPKGKPSPAAELLDTQVLVEHSRPADNDSFVEWPGPQKDVHVWWELEGGKAVAWNENPSKGWSFPVITLNKLKVWNGRGDFGYNGFEGHFYVCAESRAKAVEMLKKVGYKNVSVGEVTNYFSECWGFNMDGVKREAGVWFMPKGADDSLTPKRLL